ncbi:hypothetical protein LPJ61_003057 [Coemansia biformis]|uniref:Calcium channel YVC1-like C-terminal transmembrane domain-containing protein n=1 Tax=Coemansia biformis TaxID=1286918 RepID=A0A9W7YDS1_9FUNG|nr:hypothetical protein LPJ61_003057 [Coemansia biformis]
MVFAAAISNRNARRTSAALLRGVRVQPAGILPSTHLNAAVHGMGGYGSIDVEQQQQQEDEEPLEVDCADAYEVADDRNPVTAYYEILSLRQLLLEYVDVVLSPGQINTPDVQLNLIQPLWQAARERCGVWRRGDMRHCRWPEEAALEAALGRSGGGTVGDGRSAESKAGGPLVSAAMLYATLANRDYFVVLGSVGQSQAELHESRAEVAEALAILCAKALHSQGRQVLVNALCAKFTPIDTDGLRTRAASVLAAEAGADAGLWTPGGRRRLPLPVRGDRHMSLLSADQRVRIYRLGRAGGMAIEAVATEPSTHAGTGGVPTRGQSGCTTPVQELAQDYLSSGSRIITERTIEVAIRSEAKRFTAQNLIGNVVRMLWDGTIHWKGFRCVCLRAPVARVAAPTPDPPSQLSLPTTFERRDSTASNYSGGREPGAPAALFLEPRSRWCAGLRGGWVRSQRAHLEDWLARALAPLRIPMLENALTMVHAFFFLMLYTAVSLRRHESVTIEEAMMHVFALAYIADEIRQCNENGLAVYIKSVWNVLDVMIYTVFIMFFCLRLHGLYTGSATDLDKAFDVLALNAAMLWPRLFSVLDQYEFCGTVIIQVRRIISGTSLFFALLLVMAAGFFQMFYALSIRHNGLEASSIWGLMTRIFFGSALLGWDQADMFGPYVGQLAMTMYIGVSMLILYNILIGVINQCMMEIEQNAAQEYRFAYTMRVAEYVSANQTYPCVPPLNLLQIAVFWPLRKMSAVSPRSFGLLRSLLLLLAYAPHLLGYAAFKGCSRWWRARSGMHHRVLRAECRQAEKELALIKIRRNDIDELAFAETPGSASSEDEPVAAGSAMERDATAVAGGPSPGPAGGGAGAIVANVAADVPQGSAAPSPESTVTTGCDPEASGRWTALMDVWRSRRLQPRQPLPGPAWAPLSGDAGAAACANEGRGSSDAAGQAQVAERLAQLEAQLATVVRLLQPGAEPE